MDKKLQILLQAVIGPCTATSLQVLVRDVILSVKENNCLLKVSEYLQTAFAAETLQAEILTFVRWWW
jgi:hypothetical protein